MVAQWCTQSREALVLEKHCDYGMCNSDFFLTRETTYELNSFAQSQLVTTHSSAIIVARQEAGLF